MGRGVSVMLLYLLQAGAVMEASPGPTLSPGQERVGLRSQLQLWDHEFTRKRKAGSANLLLVAAYVSAFVVDVRDLLHMV